MTWYYMPSTSAPGTPGSDGPNGQPPADLNPRFVEALMGVPKGWLTPSTPVETVSYQAWLHTHSLSSHDEPVSEVCDGG